MRRRRFEKLTAAAAFFSLLHFFLFSFAGQGRAKKRNRRDGEKPKCTAIHRGKSKLSSQITPADCQTHNFWALTATTNDPRFPPNPFHKQNAKCIPPALRPVARPVPTLDQGQRRDSKPDSQHLACHGAAYYLPFAIWENVSAGNKYRLLLLFCGQAGRLQKLTRSCWLWHAASKLRKRSQLSFPSLSFPSSTIIRNQVTPLLRQRATNDEAKK